MDLTSLRTATGKKIQDFKIPERLLKDDAPLVELVMKSESMNDKEKQYWFDLTEVMTPEQIEKLRNILLREKDRLAEIDAKYGQKKEDPSTAFARAEAAAQQRADQQNRLQSAEKAQEVQEKAEEEAAIAELQKL